MGIDLARSEIIDWWHAERLRVSRECQATADRTKSELARTFETFRQVDILSPRSAAYLRAKRQAESNMEMLSRRLKRSIEQSVEHSIARTERSLTDADLNLLDGMAFFAPGAAAVGTVGMLAAAASLATTTTTFLVLIPVTTVSWPLLAVFGSGALALGYLAPNLMKRSTNGLRAKFLANLQAQIDMSVFGGDAASQSAAIAPQYLAQLDAIRDQRLGNLR